MLASGCDEDEGKQNNIGWQNVVCELRNCGRALLIHYAFHLPFTCSRLCRRRRRRRQHQSQNQKKANDLIFLRRKKKIFLHCVQSNRSIYLVFICRLQRATSHNSTHLNSDQNDSDNIKLNRRDSTHSPSSSPAQCLSWSFSRCRCLSLSLRVWRANGTDGSGGMFIFNQIISILRLSTSRLL